MTYNGVTSNLHTVRCGVPQGSVLGPLLFIIYSNDILNITKAILFADDTTVYHSSSNIQSLFLTMNNELDILTDWSLNVSKTNFMLFTNSNHNKTYCLQLAGQQITQSQCVKFLGMHIDNCLKWDKNIKKMKQKISLSMYAIIRARLILTTENLMTLYYSMVYPCLS